jgi:hypothetical protein
MIEVSIEMFHVYLTESSTLSLRIARREVRFLNLTKSRKLSLHMARRGLKVSQGHCMNAMLEGCSRQEFR